MEAWKEKAIQLLPERRDDIAASENIDDLWDDLEILFKDAHQKQPVDSYTIARIYDYARWCMIQTEDEWVAQAIDFFEFLPDDAAIWQELPGHMRYEEFQGLDTLFRYKRTPDEYRAFIEFAVAQFVAYARQKKKAAARKKPQPKRRRYPEE